MEEFQKQNKNKEIASWGVQELKNFIKYLEFQYNIYEKLGYFF